MAESSTHHEHIIVIGGGMLGCLTALFAARKGYRVTLFEKSDHILSGAARMAARDHSTGMEYPNDEATALACTESSFILNQIWEGADIHTQVNPMQFSADKDAAKPYYFRPEQHEDHFKKTVDLYNTLRKMHDMPPYAHHPLYEKQDEKRKEKKKERNPLSNPYFPNATEPPIQTQERGFDIPRRLSLLKAALEAEKGNINIVTGAEVVSIDKAQNRPGCYNVSVLKDGKVMGPLTVNQIFNASWEGLDKIKINGAPKKFDYKLEAKDRTIMLMDISSLPKDMPSQFVINPDGGVHAGMFSRFNDRSAFVYLADNECAYKEFSHLREQMQRAERRCKEIEQKQGRGNTKYEVARVAYAEAKNAIKREYDKAMKLYHAWAIKGLSPALKDAKPLALFRGKTLIQTGKKFDQRRYVQVDEIMPGVFWGAALKGIYAERQAIEVVEKMWARTRGAALPGEKLEEFEPEDNLSMVLKALAGDPIYRMKNTLKLDGEEGRKFARGNPDQAIREIEFLKDRNMLFDGKMLNDDSYAYYLQHGQGEGQLPPSAQHGKQGRGK